MFIGRGNRSAKLGPRRRAASMVSTTQWPTPIRAGLLGLTAVDDLEPSTKGTRETSESEDCERGAVKAATELRTPDEVAELTAQHQDLERRLHALDRHLALSAEEQL